MSPLPQPSHRRISSLRQVNHLHRCSATSILPVPLSCSSLVRRKKHPVERQGHGLCSTVVYPDSGLASRRPWRASYSYRLSLLQIVTVGTQVEDRLLEILNGSR